MTNKEKTILVLIIILVSALVSYFVAGHQANIRFVYSPQQGNEDFGYLEINGDRYRQLYTTTQEEIGNGLHIHRIDLRVEK